MDKSTNFNDLALKNSYCVFLRGYSTATFGDVTITNRNVSFFGLSTSLANSGGDG